MTSYRDRPPGTRRRSRRYHLLAASTCAAVVLSVAVAVPGSGMAAAAPSTDGAFDVTDYDVTMSYEPADGTLRGTTVVTATATGELRELALRLEGPQARAVTVDSVPADGGAGSRHRTGDADHARARLPLARPAHPALSGSVTHLPLDKSTLS